MPHTLAYMPNRVFRRPGYQDATLLGLLGITGNQWNLHSFDTAEGTGNGFPQASADVLNTQVQLAAVPEPATIGLLSLCLLGLAARLRRRRK